MSTFPSHIQQAVDLGLLQEADGKIVDCKRDEAETILAVNRVIEKIQPTSAAKADTTTDQEAIVLCRVLSSPSGVARELWTELRVAFGVSHGQNVPTSMWSTPEFRAVGQEVDATYLGERDAQLISRESLITGYARLSAGSHTVAPITFNEAVGHLSAKETMESYGDAGSEWQVALDLLRQARVKSLYNETMHTVQQVQKADTKMEKTIEFQQQRLMECLGMLRGTIGQQGNSERSNEALFGAGDGQGLIDKVMGTSTSIAPVSTGIAAFDIDMEGGVYPSGTEFTGGRMFALAARTGVGKTILAVDMAMGLVAGGLTVGFVSAELDKSEIWTRIASCMTTKFNDNTGWASVGAIKQPEEHSKERTGQVIANASMALQESTGEIIVDAPWAPDVDDVINILRSMKARNPDLRAAFVDHFHVLKRHKSAPHNESAMMEERAYKLMSAAKELQIDLFVLAQMNRVGMDALSAKQAPGLDQIRGTDAISHVCHAVWIARKQMNQQTEGEGGPSWSGALELWHAKTRGRQAEYINGRISAIKGYVEMTVLEMDYSHSRVKRCVRDW